MSMIAGAFLMMMPCMYSISADESNILKEFLSQTILSKDEFQNELRNYIKNLMKPFNVPKTASEWLIKSKELRDEIFNKVVFRGIPNEWYENEPNVVWGSVIETDNGYIIKKLRYEALPNLWVPALLYEPKEIDGKIPAILNVNGHVGPPGKTQDYEQIRCINLAKRGMLALHPEWLVFGELSGDDYKHNRLAYLDLCGASGVSVFYLAMKRGIDVLAMYPKTDPKKIAMTGLSGGGWQTIILSSLDERISLSIPNAGYIGLNYRADFIEDTGDLEQNPNDLITIADYPCLTAMLAPRPALLIYNEKDDCCFQAYRAKESVYNPIKPFYELFGKADDFVFYENKIPGTHNYDKDNREQLYRFLNKYFIDESKRIDGDIPSDSEVLKYDDLVVGIPENNENFFTLASKIMKDLPKNHPPKGDPDSLKEWQEDSRKKLRDILRLDQLSVRSEIEREGFIGKYKTVSYKIKMNDSFTIPCIAIYNPESNIKSVNIVFSDSGKVNLSEYILGKISESSATLMIDPLFMGECIPIRGPVWQYVQMISTAGKRTLGIQTAQVGAIIEWACQEFGVDKVSLSAKGWNSCLIAIMACGLYNHRINEVSIDDYLESLKMLIENHLDYETYPSLFCFGLLEQFDIPELIELCDPVPVIKLSGSSY